MKKVIFSAVAMIAFVGSSIANTVAIEEEKVVAQVDCVNVAIAALDAADPNNTMTQSQSDAFYQGQYNACIKSTNQLTQAPK
jgi:hypothetical protein